jgi:DNA-binding transcriptional ArsR family regulator
MFRALADGSRRQMVERLVRGPATVSDLADPLDMALPSVMQHLSVLAQAGIVDSQKVGRVRTVQLVPGVLDRAAAWIGNQRTPAERQADRLAAHLTPTAKD